MPVIGWFADKYNGPFSAPLAFACRGAVMMMFLFLADNPESFITYFTATFMITFSFYERIVIEKMFIQSLPSKVRGTMLGFLHLFGQIG